MAAFTWPCRTVSLNLPQGRGPLAGPCHSQEERERWGGRRPSLDVGTVSLRDPAGQRVQARTLGVRVGLFSQLRFPLLGRKGEGKGLFSGETSS